MFQVQSIKTGTAVRSGLKIVNAYTKEGLKLKEENIPDKFK